MDIIRSGQPESISSKVASSSRSVEDNKFSEESLTNMGTKQITDWGKWWFGLRPVLLRAGAESIVTQTSALLGTNGIANLQIPGLSDIGMGWKTAIVTMILQFVLRTVSAGAKYVMEHPDPVVEVSCDTAIISKSDVVVTTTDKPKE